MAQNLAIGKNFVQLINKTFICQAIATKLKLYYHIHKGPIQFKFQLMERPKKIAID